MIKTPVFDHWMIKTPGCDQIMDDLDSWSWFNVGWTRLLVLIKCWMIKTLGYDHGMIKTPGHDKIMSDQHSWLWSNVGWSRLVVIKCWIIKTPGLDQIFDDQDSWLWSNVGWSRLLVMIKCWILDDQDFWSCSNVGWSNFLVIQWTRPGVLIIQHLITNRSLNHPTFDHNQECWSSNVVSQLGVLII